MKVKCPSRLLTLFITLCLIAGLLPMTATPALAAISAQATGATNGADASAPDTLYGEFVSGMVPEEYPLSYPPVPMFVAYSHAPAYDARALDYVSTIKNQGANGLCWAFATYAAAEANMLLNSQGQQDFSELHMGYSTSSRSGNTQGWNRDPGDGGNRHYAASYLMRGTDLSGTVSENDDPYIATVLPARDLSITQGKPKDYTVQDFIFLSGETKESILPESIKDAILEYGAVGASMYWPSENTTSGATLDIDYYNNATSSFFYNGGSGALATNHAVTIVGWDDDYAAGNFNSACQPISDGAWLVKNSWGTSFGDDGYFWISYEDTNFPLYAFAINGVGAYDPSLTVYEDDYKNDGSSTGLNNPPGDVLWFAEVFTVKNTDKQLNSVKVFIPVSNTTVTVYATENFTEADSLNITTAGATRNLTYPGWYTFEFSTPVALEAADSEFAVVVEISNEPGKPNHIGFSSDAQVNRSFSGQLISSTDIYWVEDSVNYTIKAVVGDAGTPATTTPEDTPTAAIDYLTEELTGLIANGDYTLDGASFTADADGRHSITPGSSALSLPLVKKGNGTTTTDSEAQTLSIPARPAAPAPDHTNCTTDDNNDGTITGVNSTMEYSSDNATWSDVTGTTVVGLAPGTYHVRVKAVAGASFRGLSGDPVTISAFSPDPKTDVGFEATQVGGASGKANSTGLEIVFDQAVTGLAQSYITIMNDTGEVTVSGGTLTGSGTTYIVSLTSVEVEGDVKVIIADFGTYTVLTESQTVTVYKYTAPLIYAIEAYPSELEFTALEGYSAITAKPITIENIGTGQITGLEYSFASGLFGDTSDFEIVGPQPATINIDGTVTISVRPKTGIAARHDPYTDALIIAGDNDVCKMVDLTFTVTEETILIYGIALDADSNKNFGSATFGYGASNLTPYFVTVSNTGNTSTGALKVELSGANASSFTLSKTAITNIAAQDADSFTVAPKADLAVGTHTATVTVSGANVVSKSFTVSFTVTAADIKTYTAEINPKTMTFTSARQGYSNAGMEKWFTITNTGTETITGLQVSLSNANFEISPPVTVTTLGPGGTMSVRVVPKEKLDASSTAYTGTLTVTGNNGVSAAATLSFTVTPNTGAVQYGNLKGHGDTVDITDLILMLKYVAHSLKDTVIDEAAADVNGVSA